MRDVFEKFHLMKKKTPACGLKTVSSTNISDYTNLQ